VASGPETWSVRREAAGLRPSVSEAVLRGGWPFVAIVGAAFLMQFAVAPIAGEYIAGQVLRNAGIAVVLAVALNFVNGLTGQFSIGHAGFMAVGGYTSAMITYYGSLLIWGTSAQHPQFLGPGEWLFAFSCVVGGFVGAAMGYVVGLPSLRLKGDYLAIVTLGFGEIVRVLLELTNPVLYSANALKESTWSEWIPPPVGGSLGFSNLPGYTNLFWVTLAAGITILAAIRVKFSSQGRMLIAIREDEIAAQAMGVHVTQWKVRAFVVSAFFAGLAGGLHAHAFRLIAPENAGFALSFELVIMVVLGGRGSVTGVTLAALILSPLAEVLREFSEYRMIIYALVLIVMMLVRPQGLFGMHEIWDYFPRMTKHK
jgi:branched-chain amino acid transport system permease protein